MLATLEPPSDTGKSLVPSKTGRRERPLKAVVLPAGAELSSKLRPERCPETVLVLKAPITRRNKHSISVGIALWFVEARCTLDVGHPGILNDPNVHEFEGGVVALSGFGTSSTVYVRWREE